MKLKVGDRLFHFIDNAKKAKALLGTVEAISPETMDVSVRLSGGQKITGAYWKILEIIKRDNYTIVRQDVLFEVKPQSFKDKYS